MERNGKTWARIPWMKPDIVWWKICSNIVLWKKKTPTWKSGKCEWEINSYPVNQLLNNIPVKKEEKKTKTTQNTSTQSDALFFHRKQQQGFFFADTTFINLMLKQIFTRSKYITFLFGLLDSLVVVYLHIDFQAKSYLFRCQFLFCTWIHG